MSIREKRVIPPSTRRSRSSCLPAWAAIPTARSGNFVLIRSASSSRSTCLRLDRTTWAPCSASASAMALPMPRLAPVTRATRPSRSNRELGDTADTIARLNGDYGESGGGHPRAHLPAHDQAQRHGPGRGNAAAPQAPRLCSHVQQGFLLAGPPPEVCAPFGGGGGEPPHALRLLPHAHPLARERPRGGEQTARPLGR